MTLTDPEVLRDFGDQPSLLAVADALSEVLPSGVPQAPNGRSVTRWLSRGALTAAALASVAIFSILAFGGGNSTLVERALASVGNDPVLHAVIRQSGSSGSMLINLKTGRVTSPQQTMETEIWYDRAGDRAHILSRTNGVLSGDVLSTPSGAISEDGPVWTCERIAAYPVEAARARVSCSGIGVTAAAAQSAYKPTPLIDPAVAGFMDGYRGALAHGDVRKVREGVIDGRRVNWLAFPVSVARENVNGHMITSRHSEEVAIDSKTARPLQIRALINGHASTPENVARVDTVPRALANFARPRTLALSQQISRGDIVRTQRIPLAEAQQVFTAPGEWMRLQLNKRPLAFAARVRVRTVYLPHAHHAASVRDVLELTYGKAGNEKTDGSFIRVDESAKPEYALGWFLTGAKFVPPAGYARTEMSNGWTFFKHNRTYFRITGSQHAEVLRAAREITRVIQ